MRRTAAGLIAGHGIKDGRNQRLRGRQSGLKGIIRGRMAVKKKLWKKQKFSIRTVGLCLYCKKEVTNDMRFVVFATKEPAHHSCYTKEENKKQMENNGNL